ncbi:MAG: PAS domain S-box protein [Candidatus Hodarchaeales archaeon]|jgi:PAS domain S-box-containing protein
MKKLTHLNDNPEEEIINVLHIDDDKNFLELVKILLEEKNSNLLVDTLSHPEEAFQKLEEKDYDVVISDYKMPSIDGIDILDQLRKSGKEVAFIIFTGKGRKEIAIQALNLGADYYLEKGDPDILIAELNHFITVEARKKKNLKHRLKIERALKESEEKFRELADMLPQTIFEIDTEGNITYVNTRGFKSFGYTQEELEKGLSAYKMFVPEERERISSNISKVLKGEEPDHEFIAHDKNGNTFPVLIYTSPIISNNEQAGLRGILVDITEQKKIEEELRESEEKFRMISEQHLFGIVIFQEDEVKYVNRACAEIFGYSVEEISSWSIIDITEVIHQDYRSQAIERAREVQLESVEDVSPQFIVPIITKSGKTKWVETYSRRMTYEGRRAVFITFNDITTRKETEERFRKLSKLQQEILETSFDGIIVIDFEGNINFANKALARLSGFTKVELLELNISQITVGLQFVSNLIESAKKDRKIINFETVLLTSVMEPIPVLLSSSLIKDEDKVLIVLRDLRVEKEYGSFRESTVDFIYMSLFKMGSLGPEIVVTEPFPTKTDEEEVEILSKMAIYYMTVLGQGSDYNTGLFGPFPIPGSDHLVSLVYSFIIDDPVSNDPRTKGRAYSFIAMSIPKTLIRLFSNRTALINMFERELTEYTTIQDIDLDVITTLKRKIVAS